MIDTRTSRSIAIGNFDGFHVGHRALLQSALLQKEDHEKCSIVTFDPHPREALQPGVFVPRLSSLEERIRLLQQNGADEVLVIPFNSDFAQVSARSFFEDYIIDKWNARHLSFGPNFYFGHNREGTPNLLRQWMADAGRGACIIDPTIVDGKMVSSSKIRDMLREGDVAGAAKMLGRPHRIRGIVASGFKKGRALGFPTANLYPLRNPPPQICVPLEGVYATTVALEDGRCFKSISNIGFRPTIHHASPLSFETHLFDFSEELYGQSISVNLLDRLRPEIRFPSLADLKAQIVKDIEICRAYHKKI